MPKHLPEIRAVCHKVVMEVLIRRRPSDDVYDTASQIMEAVRDACHANGFTLVKSNQNDDIRQEPARSQQK